MFHLVLANDLRINIIAINIIAANIYYSSAGYQEQKIKKTTGQIKFSMVTKKMNKTSLTKLSVNELNAFSSVLLLQFYLQHFMSNQITYYNVSTSFNKESKDYKRLLFV